MPVVEAGLLGVSVNEAAEGDGEGVAVAVDVSARADSVGAGAIVSVAVALASAGVALRVAAGVGELSFRLRVGAAGTLISPEAPWLAKKNEWEGFIRAMLSTPTLDEFDDATVERDGKSSV